MRKIIALVLAIVMIAAMAISVSANKDATDNKLNDDNNAAASQEVPVTYTSSQGYEVTIPDNFNLVDAKTVEGATVEDGIAEGSGVVEATKAKLSSGKKLIVTVTSKNSWKLVDPNGATPIAYSVAIVNTADNGNISGALGSDGKVLEYTSSAATWSNKKSTMNLTTVYSNQAGEFADTLTFKAEVK